MRREKSSDVENHPRQDHTDGDRRVAFCTFLVRCKPSRVPIKAVLVDSLFHEQYQDTVASVTQRAEDCCARDRQDGEWTLDPRALLMFGAASAIELF
jgi:hypothetical protein